MRLIDADAMKDDIEWQSNLLKMMFNDDEGMLNLADIMHKGYIAQIDKMPTIDWKQNLTTKLHQLEMFNEDIPKWVWKVIEGM